MRFLWLVYNHFYAAAALSSIERSPKPFPLGSTFAVIILLLINYEIAPPPSVLGVVELAVSLLVLLAAPSALSESTDCLLLGKRVLSYLMRVPPVICFSYNFCLCSKSSSSFCFCLSSLSASSFFFSSSSLYYSFI